jgi:hypothetical protein
MRAVCFASFLLIAATGSAAAEPGVDAPTGPRSPAPDWTLRSYVLERWLGTSSAVTLATTPISGGGAAVERRIVTFGLPGPFHTLDVTGEAGFDAGSTDGTTFQQLDNHIETWEVTAGARARLPLLSWLHLQARASVGGAHTSVRIADGSMPMTAIADSGNSMVASTGIGLGILPRLTEADRGAFHVGVDIELGYETATATTIRAYPENRPSEDLTIPAHYASLGALDLDGWTLRIGATIGF